MNWNAHPNLYQFTHWWHWLAYGQNASVLGLLGLIAYVIYTRRMMVAAEETRRLSLTPYLIATISEDAGQPILNVTNVAAPAVRCEVWIQVTDPGVKLGMRFMRPATISAKIIDVIASGRDYKIPMLLLPDDSEVIYVIDCFDTGNGRYQLQILQRPMPDSQLQIECSFSIPDTFQPQWKRLFNRIGQLYKIHKFRSRTVRVDQ